MKAAELKVLPVAILKPAEYNPRKKLKPGDKEYEKIKASIEVEYLGLTIYELAKRNAIFFAPAVLWQLTFTP